jgi:hypothetical protein
MLLAYLALCFSSEAITEMASENYHMGSTTFSSGGAPTGSASYRMNSTFGQPSPLMNPIEPPISDSYDLYPGFWYAIVSASDTCPGDDDFDKDIDGVDLAAYIFDQGGISLSDFASNFGKAICP